MLRMILVNPKNGHIELVITGVIRERFFLLPRKGFIMYPIFILKKEAFRLGGEILTEKAIARQAADPESIEAMAQDILFGNLPERTTNGSSDFWNC